MKNAESLSMLQLILIIFLFPQPTEIKAKKLVIKILIFLSIMKKYDKLNLTSQMYREKSNRKSPVPPLRLFEVQEQQPFKKRYINACCPNCKYLFKIPKQGRQQQRSKTPTTKRLSKQNYLRQRGYKLQMGSKDGRKSIKQKQIQVQTQPYLLGSFKVSPKRQLMPVQRNYQRGTLTDRTPQRWERIKTNPMDSYNQPDIPLFSQRKYEKSQKEQSIVIERSTSRKRQASKSNQRVGYLARKSPKNVLSSSKKQQFPVRSAYFGYAKQSVKKTTPIKMASQKVQNLRTLYKQEVQLPQISPQPKITPQNSKQLELIEMKTIISNELLQKIYLTQQIGQIIQYQMNLPPEMSVPSYCKMLAYQLQDRREVQMKKQMQSSQKMNMKRIDLKCEEDLPKFSTKPKKEVIF